MRRGLLIMLIICLCVGPLTGNAAWVVVEDDDVVTSRELAMGLLWGMSLEEKIYQLFIVSPEDLTGETQTTQWPEKNPFLQYPVGGMILYGRNIVSEEQLKGLAEAYFLDVAQAGVYAPFLAVDEEGGYVARVANKLGYPLTLTPESMGKLENPALALDAGRQIGEYLSSFGINLDFAPVADVLVQDGGELGSRSFGKDPDVVAQMALSMADGLRQQGLIPCFKHFPGHGAITGDTHDGKVISKRSRAKMAAEWAPFEAGIDQDIEMIMVSHFIAAALDDKYPCALSEKVIDGLLRREMGYDGVVITDALRMDAIADHYDSDEAAVLAIQAGADLLLLPNNFRKAVRGIIQAVEKGQITEERIDESVIRILELKIKAGLIR